MRVGPVMTPDATPRLFRDVTVFLPPSPTEALVLNLYRKRCRYSRLS